MALVVPALSLEYIRVRISAQKNGVVINPTSDAVQMSFPAQGAAPSAWNVGSWETATVNGSTEYYARCLVGPGGTVTLTAGKYDIWVKITDSPEIPVIFGGRLVIQ